MTEPLSQQPLRLMRKAKELPHPPHRVTLSSGEKGESQRRVLLCAPTPASHPVAFKPNPNQPVPRSLPGEAGYVLCRGRGGDGLISQVVLPIAFRTLTQLWGWGLQLTFLSLQRLAVCLCLPDLQSQGRALLSHLWASFCQSWTRAHLSKLPNLDQKPKLRL